MKRIYLQVVLSMALALIIHSCIEEENGGLPSVQTNPATEITTNSATLSGSIISTGGTEITEKGIFVSEDQNPDENDYLFLDDGIGDGISIPVVNMEMNTVYYFRAFASNAYGTSYGEVLSVTTLNESGGGTTPVVQTNSASEITSTSAKLMATIISNGGSSILDRGFYIDMDGDPDENDYAFSVEGVDNPYFLTVDGMEPMSTYYYTAYITTESITIAGDVLSVTTVAEGETGCSYTGTIIDPRDNRSYNIIKIGSQTWMAENMAYDAGAGSWAFSNDESNVAVHGRLYTWEVATNVCPSGWHLPSNEEWDELAKYISADQGGYDTDGRVWANVGTHLKTSDVWILSNNASATGTNDYCFSAVPGGLNSDGVFSDLLTYGEWWTNFETDDTPHLADNRVLIFSENKFFHQSNAKRFGLSVRCIKD